MIGVLAAKGQSLGLDMDDLVIIPVASAQSLFNTASLFRILVQATGREMRFRGQAGYPAASSGSATTAKTTSPSSPRTRCWPPSTEYSRALTLAVAGIAAISLVVAGILIMNVMLIAVSQRTAEIGLLKAIGAPGRQIQALFLAEAALLSLIGTAIGAVLAQAGLWAFGRLLPVLPLRMPLWALAAATAVALSTGLVFGVLPARRRPGSIRSKPCRGVGLAQRDKDKQHPSVETGQPLSARSDPPHELET